MILSGLREINFLNLFVAFDEMLLKKNKVYSIRRVNEMDLGNFGGHEV